MPLVAGFLDQRLPHIFAAKALLGLIGDAQNLSLTLMQWYSAPSRPWKINSEIGAMEGELLRPSEEDGEPQPLLSYVRYNVTLEEQWLEENLGRTTTAEELGKLKQLDRPEMIDQLSDIGAMAAAKQVREDDFPVSFARSWNVSTLMPIGPNRSENAVEEQ